MKRQHIKKYFIGLFLILAVTLAIYLWAVPKNFSAVICPYKAGDIDYCTVFTLEREPLHLQDENLSKLLELFENTDYYFRTIYQHELVGNIFHVVAHVNTEGKRPSFTILISDEGYIYMDGKTYVTVNQTLYEELVYSFYGA